MLFKLWAHYALRWASWVGQIACFMRLLTSINGSFKLIINKSHFWDLINVIKPRSRRSIFPIWRFNFQPKTDTYNFKKKNSPELLTAIQTFARVQKDILITFEKAQYSLGYNFSAVIIQYQEGLLRYSKICLKSLYTLFQFDIK